MKKLLSTLLVISLVFSLTACGETKTDQADNIITISTGNGTNQTYLLDIQKAVKRDLNIDLEFVYQYSSDTSNSIVQEFKNNDLCADIMVTAMAVDNAYLEDTCLDYLTSSHITDYFTYSKVKEYTAENGSVYQLPFTSKLIGITYNKTLMEEMGWDVPKNYNDMAELKKKCDANHIPFAVSGCVAAGHGFNWLFHLMGADWLSTLEGTEWFDSYLQGETTVDAFAEEAQYFKKYYESGFFGECCRTIWDTNDYYRQQRALFNYNLTNSLSEGLRLNKDGTVYGAEYDENGEIKAVKSNTGAYICLNDVWTVYDDKNILHQNEQRYDIPGARVDEFATMPWISEDGNNNRFTCYDNMFLMLNKKLGEGDQKDKLEKVLKVLEYMCDENVTQYFSDENRDGYIAVNNFKINEDRLYYKFKDQVEVGYIQPWYYILVDTNTLVAAGDAVNDYMAGGTTSFDDVIAVFNKGITDHIHNVTNPITKATATFTYPELAELLAYTGAEALQKKLKENNIEKEVTVSLMPYTENCGDMAPWSLDQLGLVSTKLYAGELEESFIGTIFSSKASTPLAIEMTGAEIRQIVEEKLDRSAGGKGYDPAYGPYPYVVITKNGKALEDNKTYLTAVNELSLNEDVYRNFLEKGKVIVDSEGTPICGDLKEALIEYFKANPTVTPGKINWK